METGRQTRDVVIQEAPQQVAGTVCSGYSQWIWISMGKSTNSLGFSTKGWGFPSISGWQLNHSKRHTSSNVGSSWLCRNNEKSIGYWTPAPFRSKIFPAHAESGWMASVLVAVDAIIWKPWSRTLNLTNLNRPLINELHGFEFGQTKKRNETANSHFHWLAFNTTLVDWRLKSTCRFTQHDLQIEP